jgi:hypothetical protein
LPKGVGGILEATSPKVAANYATAASIHQAQNVTLSVRTSTGLSILPAAADRTLTSSNFIFIQQNHPNLFTSFFMKILLIYPYFSTPG